MELLTVSVQKIFSPEVTRNSKIIAEFQERQRLGRSLRNKVGCFVGIHGIEVAILSNRFVNQMADPDVSHNVPSSTPFFRLSVPVG